MIPNQAINGNSSGSERGAEDFLAASTSTIIGGNDDSFETNPPPLPASTISKNTKLVQHWVYDLKGPPVDYKQQQTRKERNIRKDVEGGRGIGEFDVSISKHEDKINPWKTGKSVRNVAMERSTSMVVEHGRLAWEFKQLVPYSISTFWAIFLMFVFGWGDWAMFNGRNPSCKTTVDWDLDASASFCMLSPSLEAGSTTLKILSAFVLGGFLMSSRNLWLTKRSSYCALCGATRNIIINVCTLVPPEHQKLFARWSVLGFELSVLKARMLIDSDEAKEYLQACGLIKEDEWESMVNGDRHTTVWYWIQSKAKQLKNQGSISEFELQTICNAVTLSRDRANDLMSPIDRNQPPPYVFVCAVLINLSVFLHSTAKGFEWAEFMHDVQGHNVWKYPSMYVDIFILLTFTTIYSMMFDVCALMYNPFGPREIDIQHRVVGKGIRGLAQSLAKGVHPKSMKVSFLDDSMDSTDAELDEMFDSNVDQKIAGKVTQNLRMTLLPLHLKRKKY